MTIIPERTAAAAELPAPAELAALALLVPCGHCWAPPGLPCVPYDETGDLHLARYLRAERRGVLGRQALAAVIARLDVIAAHVLVPDVPR